MNQLTIPRTEDFEVTAQEEASHWRQAAWCDLSPVKGSATYRTRAKLLYSNTGLYFLFSCEDEILTCTLTEDFANLFTEDVLEVFLQPLPEQPLYLEYEISPLGMELPILVPNHLGRFHGWAPWHYEGNRKVRHATRVHAGEKKAMARCKGWTAEFFIPFALLGGVGPMPPTPGTTWRANLYRIDYDNGLTTHWAWDPATGTNFHDFHNFGSLLFA